jgi:hypothetical protein
MVEVFEEAAVGVAEHFEFGDQHPGDCGGGDGVGHGLLVSAESDWTFKSSLA